jgi:uncharacterized protein YjbI with pentapeptide repeats
MKSSNQKQTNRMKSSNQKQLVLLQQGVKGWNRWREKNLSVEVDLSGAYFREANFREANLSKVDLSRSDLSRANLSGANLSGANLNGADLSGTNLNGANLSKANLGNTLLIASQLLKSNLTAANLTGACIQDWNINSATQLDDVTCKYIYLKSEWSWQEQKYLRRDRRPSSPNRIFASGEFTKLFQKAFDTVDLIFTDGIDWKAFFQSKRSRRKAVVPSSFT